MGCGSSKNTVVEDTNRRTPACDKSHHDHNVNNALPSETSATRLDLLGDPKPAESEPEERPHVSVGERVHVFGYTGVVLFLGRTDLGGGTWVGVRLDRSHPQGNSGSFNGVEYFTCKPKHGLFARPGLVFPHTEIIAIEESTEISMKTVVFIQQNIRRFLAKIRAKKYQHLTGIEREIDAHVLKTPISKEKSVAALSEYLSNPWETERSKAFSIFRWMTFNISYDVDGFFGSRAKQSCDPQSVLESKLSVCAGYANLFEALCKAASLEVHTVSGYAKGYGHQPGQKATGVNHAWNAIRVNREWRICDVTWGAGYLGEDMMFHRSANTHTFLMDSEVAITDHLPEDDKWQLLEKPVDREEFEKLVVPSGHLHSMGVELESHKYAEYQVDADHIEMDLYSPSTKILSGTLKYSSGKDVGERNRVQIRAAGANKLKVKVEFPASGTYRLELHVRVNEELHHGVRYVLHSRRGVGADRGGFPQLGRDFHALGFALQEPLENIETNDGRAVISLECYSRRFSTLRAFVEPSLMSRNENKKKDLQLTCTEKTCSGFVVKVHLADPGMYKVNIFASYREEGKSGVYICTYYVNAHARVEPIAGFPRLSDSFHSWGLELVEPVENIFAENGQATVKIKIPEDVSLVGYLKKGQESLDNSLCCTRKEQDTATIFVHTTDAGLFKLNIFGSKGSDSKQEYMCSYAVKASRAANDNPGFPRLAEDFNKWGLALADQHENIVTHENRVCFSLSVPGGIKLNPWLFDDHDHQIGKSCSQYRDEGNVEICCELPKAGKYKLNLFGVNMALDTNKNVFLYCVSILYK